MRAYRVNIDIEVDAENGEDAINKACLVAIKTHTMGIDAGERTFCARGMPYVNVETIE